MDNSYKISLAILLSGVLILCVLAIISIVSTWKVYKKAGKPGWGCLVPFYNMYLLYEITWGNGWLFLLLLIPVGNLIISVATMFKLSKSFDRGIGFGFGLIFIPFVFYLILAFGDSEYIEPYPRYKKGIIIASSVVGVLYIISVIFFVAIGTFYVNKSISERVEPQSVIETKDKVVKKETSIFNSIDGYTEFKTVEIDNGYISIEVPMLEDEYGYVSGSSAVSSKDGVSVSVNLGYEEKDNYKEELTRVVEESKDIKESLDFYSDISLEDVELGDEWATQQINYIYNLSDKDYSNFDICKVGQCDKYLVYVTISFDGSMENENTEATLREVCEIYGVDAL